MPFFPQFSSLFVAPFVPFKLTNGLLAYWKFDTDSWIDSGTNNSDLTGYNDVSTGTGIISDCVLIESDQFLDNSLTNFNVGTGDISIYLWINPASYGSGGYNDFAGSIIDFRNDGGGKEWLLIFNNVGKLRIWQLPTSYESAASIPLDEWTNIIISRSGGTTSVYINGSLDGSFEDNKNFQSQKFTIGGPVNNPNTSSFLHYDGKLDEMGIWGRALAQSEITELYNNGDGLTYPFN